MGLNAKRDEHFLDFYPKSDITWIASYNQVRQSMHTHVVGKLQHHEKDLARLTRLFQDKNII